MFSKRANSILKLIILLTFIIIISIMHYYLSEKFDKKKVTINNRIKLIEKNDALIKEIIVYTDNLLLKRNAKNIELLTNSSELYNYSISVLINGGVSNEEQQSLIIPKPDQNELQKLLELERIWIDYSSQLSDIILEKESKTTETIDLIEGGYNIILNQHDSIKKIYLSKSEKIEKYFDILHISAVSLYIIFAFILYIFIRNTFFRSIGSLEHAIDNLSLGKSDVKFDVKNDFKGVYSNLNKLNYKINEISDFVNQLVKDNYDIRFEDYNKKDPLVQSLVKLRDKLKDNVELNKQRQEEERLRQWSAEGNAKFNDILRESSSDIKSLAEASIVNLVKFFDAAQGGFFVINDQNDPPVLELTSAFAYDRIKSLTKKIQLGDGLVGMCALEKNTIWLNNVPEGYMEIESGLGEASPTNILIIPVKTEDNILGVIEIASFNKFNKNEVQFIENLAEDIASTLETTKISGRTSYLLAESQKKSDELAMRDSEMSEKIEQLRESQIETKRSESEMMSLIGAVDKVLFKLEISTVGRVLTANNLFLNISGYRINEIRNKNFFDFLDETSKNEAENLLKRLKKNEPVQTTITLVTKQNTKLKILSLFSGIKNEADQVERILLLGDNISYREELEKKNETLRAEIEYKSKQIAEKEKDFKKTSGENAESFKKREKILKDKFETELEKKYSDWLEELKS